MANPNETPGDPGRTAVAFRSEPADRRSPGAWPDDGDGIRRFLRPGACAPARQSVMSPISPRDVAAGGDREIGREVGDPWAFSAKFGERGLFGMLVANGGFRHDGTIVLVTNHGLRSVAPLWSWRPLNCRQTKIRCVRPSWSTCRHPVNAAFSHLPRLEESGDATVAGSFLTIRESTGGHWLIKWLVSAF